jgi:tight adherence protein B
MIALLIGSIGALGVFYVYTSWCGWKGFGFGSSETTTKSNVRPTLRDWMTQAGIGEVTPAEYLVVTAAAMLMAGLASFVVFGALLPSVTIGMLAGLGPLAAYRGRRVRLRNEARDAWPRLIEELRVQTSSVGRSIPVALFEVGKGAPTQPMRDAFVAAHREWLLTTDFERTIKVLKQRLADPAADSIAETLLVAYELGGSDLDTRLRALIEDRICDLDERRDAVSRQSGVRFARWFTLVVPVGMALVGMSIGNGRDAYQTNAGQLSLFIAILCTAGCWIWASRIMRLPDTERVLDR